MVKWVTAFKLSNTYGVGWCRPRLQQPIQADSQLKSVGLVWGSAAAWRCYIYQINSHPRWLCHDHSSINIVVGISGCIVIRPPDSSREVLCFTAVLLYHQDSNLQDGWWAPHANSRPISAVVPRFGTKTSLIHFAYPLLWFYRESKSEKSEIRPRFSIPDAFEALWFRKGAKYRKSKTRIEA